MPEREEIREVIKKYQGYLEGSDLDIAQTVKGVWFFLIHDSEAESYYRFFRFKSADELEKGIVEAIADELCTLVETSVESCSFRMGDTDFSGVLDGSCSMALTKLEKDIRILDEECRKVMGRLEKVMESLSGVLELK